jgi:hypothetical protein
MFIGEGVNVFFGYDLAFHLDTSPDSICSINSHSGMASFEPFLGTLQFQNHQPLYPSDKRSSNTGAPLATGLVTVWNQNYFTTTQGLRILGQPGRLGASRIGGCGETVRAEPLGIFLPFRQKDDWCLKHLAQVIQNLPFAFLIDPAAVTVWVPLKETFGSVRTT